MGAFAIPGIGDTVALAKKSVNAIKGGLKSLKGIKNINALKKVKGIKKALAVMPEKAKTGASRLKKGKECIYETNCERRQEMLQGDRKMFKFIKEQKNINKIIIISFLCVFITGCSQPVKEETSQAVVKEDEIQEDKGVQPVQEKKKEKLSEMYDWNKAKIPMDWYYPNFGEGQVLQNQDYIFYPEEDNKIIRIRKSDGMKEIICEFDYNKNACVHYCLADNGMFVEYASDIYFCGLDGKNQYKIISRKKLKKQITAIEDKGWMRGICTLYFYKDSLYLVSHYYMWKLDLTTKKITKMSELTMGGCFCGNTLYYMDFSQRMVYKTNIHTGKSTLVLGNKEVSSTSYYGLTETDGKLYYVKCKG